MNTITNVVLFHLTLYWHSVFLPMACYQYLKSTFKRQASKCVVAKKIFYSLRMKRCFCGIQFGKYRLLWVSWRVCLEFSLADTIREGVLDGFFMSQEILLGQSQVKVEINYLLLLCDQEESNQWKLTCILTRTRCTKCVDSIMGLTPYESELNITSRCNQGFWREANVCHFKADMTWNQCWNSGVVKINCSHRMFANPWYRKQKQWYLMSIRWQPAGAMLLLSPYMLPYVCTVSKKAGSCTVNMPKKRNGRETGNQQNFAFNPIWPLFLIRVHLYNSFGEKMSFIPFPDKSISRDCRLL